MHFPRFGRSACNLLCAGGYTNRYAGAARYANDRAVTNDGDDNTAYDNTTDDNATDDRDNNAINPSFSRRTR